MTTAPRVLITVSADVASDSRSGPRRDYAALADVSDATVLDRTDVLHSPLARVIRALVGLAPAQAWLAFRKRNAYDVIVTDGEHVGIPLAALLRLTRSSVKHVTIGHRLSSPKKRRFFTVLGVHRRMDRIVVHARAQAAFATTQLGVGRERLALVPYQVDTKFWSPTSTPEERLVVSAGLEHRDYATLARAVEGVDVQVVVGAASNWSRHRFAREPLPANVSVGSFDYSALRELYARAAIVVVPLDDVDNQAGVTTILEAMAMGKAVVVTQSLGQTDVVEDRRRSARGGDRPRPTSLAQLLAQRAGLDIQPNGFYVAPKDARALRGAISYLLEHPDERARLGGAGRRVVEELFTLEQFAARMRSVIDATLGTESDHRALRLISYG